MTLIYNKIIVLVGMMGSGKTRVGGELARFVGLPFIDSDREIEIAANCTVSEIFKKFGEAEFRTKERQIMQRLLTAETCVLASGGGGFIQPDVRSLIKKSAISVWLKVDIDTLVERVSHKNNRPLLLQGGDIKDKLQQLMDVRYPIYAEADITVVTDGQTPQDTALQIKAEIDKFLQQ
jgi:shikimate kinase